MHGVAAGLACFLLFQFIAGAQSGRLNIVIVEGEGAINNIRQRTARAPIVQVEDQNHKPVAGAAVLFMLPESGASGVFPSASRTLTVTTDENGRAEARGLRPNAVRGVLQILITASHQGQTASAIITQINALDGTMATAGLAAKWMATVYRGAFLSVNGKVVPQTGAPTWPVHHRDEIVTEADPATIVFPDGARVVLGPKSRAMLARCERCVANLFEGSLAYQMPAVSTLEICAIGHPIKPTPNTEAAVVIEKPARVVVKVAANEPVEVAKGRCACAARDFPTVPIIIITGAGAAAIAGAAAVAGPPPASPSVP